MNRRLDPAEVAARLDRLRSLARLESVADARVRLDREQPSRRETLEERADRGLRSLRALDDLTRYLRRASRKG